jgi:hypothetical protein
MSTNKSMENMEQQFSNLSAEDLENLEVEELEQRLELAAIDFTASVLKAQLLPDYCEEDVFNLACW